MFGKPYRLFRVLGFEVRADWSWLVILALIVWSLGTGLFPAAMPGFPPATYFVMGLVAALGLFASILFHELAHSLVARRRGVTIRGITLFIFGGVAQMDDEPQRAADEWRIAVAGPILSFVLAAVAWALSRLTFAFSVFTPLAEVLGWLAFINGVLAVFNLLPGFPLDGGRILRALLWRRWKDQRRATNAAALVGRVLGWLLVAIGAVQIFEGLAMGGLWWILIGLFLRFAAGQGAHQQQIHEALAGRPVRRFMSTHPIVVRPTLSLAEYVDDYVYRYHEKLFPVVDGDRLVGCISTEDVKQVPREKWSGVSVAEVVQPCTKKNSVELEDDAYTALQRMSRQHARRLVVRQGEQLAGMISMEELMEYLTLTAELEANYG